MLAKRPWLCLAFLFVIWILLSSGIGQLQFKFDYREFFEADDPQRLVFDRIQDTFGSSDNVLFLLVPDSKTVFDAQSLKAVFELSNKSWQMPFSYRVDSNSNFQYSRAQENELIPLCQTTWSWTLTR